MGGDTGGIPRISCHFASDGKRAQILNMNLYAVRNRDGKYFRSIGYGYAGGGGKNWVGSLENAKFYTKIGQAKGRVTFFAKNYPKFGVCDILEFSLEVEQAKVLDVKDKTEKALAKARVKEEMRKLRETKYDLENLQRQKESIELKIKQYARP